MEINYNNKLITANLIICPNQGQVIMGKEVVRISPVNMKVLMLLIKNQGIVISRNQIFDSVWTNQEVSDDTLTRCISDLRAQLGKDQIKTLPKRGYQWIPKVQQYRSEESESNTSNLTTKIVLWVLMIVLGVFLLSTSSLWVANKIIQPNQTRVAILPIRFELSEQTEIANNYERVLQDLIIKSEKLKLLSTSVMVNNMDKPFPSLNQEYSIRWIVEGQLNSYNNTTKLTLSLVDARTALVVFSLTSDDNSSNENLLHLCQTFIQQISVPRN